MLVCFDGAPGPCCAGSAVAACHFGLLSQAQSLKLQTPDPDGQKDQIWARSGVRWPASQKAPCLGVLGNRPFAHYRLCTPAATVVLAFGWHVEFASAYYSHLSWLICWHVLGPTARPIAYEPQTSHYNHSQSCLRRLLAVASLRLAWVVPTWCCISRANSMQPALVDRPAARCSCLGRQYHTKPFTSHPRTQPARQARSNVSVAYPIDAVTTPSPGGGHDHNQAVREGHYEADLVKAQVNNTRPDMYQTWLAGL